MKACFIGHRKVEITDQLKDLLHCTLVSLINAGVNTFLFGSKSQFDDLSWEVVTELKSRYPFIKRVYVRSSFQYIDKPYEEYLLKFFEQTYYPSTIKNAGKYSYLERNMFMIDNSDYCIFYYDSNYIPLLQPSKQNALHEAKRSGTKLAFEYARKKHKNIINLFE